ncbi:MAG: FmdB family zinc ribbon protein [Bacteroidota bacterium]
MPIYEYVCRLCGRKTEALQTMGAGPEGLVCGACGAKGLKKVLSAPNIGRTAGEEKGSNCNTGCCGGSCGL